MVPGDRVQLHDLLFEEDLNGLDGTLLAFDPERQRWIVDIAYEKLRVKPSNLVPRGAM